MANRADTRVKLVLLVLVLVVLVMIMVVTQYHKQQLLSYRFAEEQGTWNSGLHALHIENGYLLTEYYREQMTSASKNLQHLQCWAGGLDMEVVEPFIVGSHLGVRDPLDNHLLKFSDIYDMNIWTTASNHTLASWDSFIQKAPRNLIRVEIRWDETADKVDSPNCNLPMKQSSVPQYLQQQLFTLVRHVCIHPPLNVRDFNERVFGEHWPNMSTVLLNSWRGLVSLGLHNIGSCVKSGPKVRSYMHTSQRAIKDTETYVAKYLKTSDYLAVMVRMEKVRKSNLDMTGCFQQTLETWKKMVTDTGSNSTFLAADMGRFGSSTFRKYYIDHLQGQFRDFFKTIYGNSLTMKQWESTFVDVSGIENPVYVSGVQKTLAARAKCLLLVGGGSFQGNAMQLYLDSHGPEERCTYSVCMPS